MTTVGDLLEYLNALNPDLPIIIAADNEGTHFSPLAKHGITTHQRYKPDTTWNGNIYGPNDCSGKNHQGCNYCTATPAAVLWPN